MPIFYGSMVYVNFQYCRSVCMIRQCLRIQVAKYIKINVRAAMS